MTPEQATLKHWIKQLLRARMDMDEVKQAEKDLPIDEFLSKTHRLTLDEGRAEQVIGELIQATPALEQDYPAIQDAAHEELVEERERDADQGQKQKPGR
ncbi:hypothetical protein C882_0125 [Caenispirillum salinarum AK4]|uniref:Uncharacterized protein n=1 Tax=Caenispirillum salinarum AK4 TaxID=1238182 RepID=K9GZ35_9PROT|nr:hypothetical protein [Caenispirillum salinarum]EKV30044.1 hypothetical protein C882_0125 [Caenispirillum salinarum AK4]